MSSKRELEIEARFVEERHRWGDCGVSTAVILETSRELASKSGFVGSTLSLKGDCAENELETGLSYRFFGTFRDWKNKRTGKTEKQFHFSSFCQIAAHDEEGVVAYLEAAGRGNGMGYGTAKKAWLAWGSDAVRTVREEPRKLLELNNRISDDQLVAIGMKLLEQQRTESATIEITNVLHGRGFPKTLPRKCIQRWGNKAAEIICKDPYRLMAFRGCGFKTCDKLYLELGLDPTRLRRQALCGWYSVASDSSGDVWFPVERVSRAIRSAIGPKADPDRAIEFGERLGRLSPDHYGAIATIRSAGVRGPISQYGDRIWVAEGRKARQEDKLAQLVHATMDEMRPKRVTTFKSVEREVLHYLDHVRCQRCSRQLTAPEVHVWNGKPFGPTCIQTISDGDGVTIVELGEWLSSHPVVNRIIEERPGKLVNLPEYSLWPEIEQLEIDSHQCSELSKALTGRLAIFGGSPGTGKTYTVAQLVRVLLRSGFSPEDIAIGAPTGKAAVRLTGNMVGLPVRARTWHSLLGVGERDPESGNFGFHYNEFNPWSYRVIIGDESSMDDTSLMCAIFAARARGSHVLIVGDVHQLPPVGSGAPLRDMIGAGLPYGELTEIWRNSGGIVEACAAIRDEKPWECGGNLCLGLANSPEKQLSMIESLLDRCPSHKLDPVWDVQVLCAVNLRSEVSRRIVNQRLQAYLNPNEAIAGSPFRVADKIVCTKNGYYTLTNPDFAGGIDAELVDDDGRVYVANGELAKVLSVESNKIIAELYNPSREIIIPRGKSESDGSDDGEVPTGCNFDLAYGLSVHKCVHPETLVESQDGLIPIRNLPSSGLIGTPFGPQAYCNRVTYEDSDCVEITTNEGNSITVTLNHKCEAWDGQQYSEKLAGDLVEGDFIRTALFASLEPNEDATLPQCHGFDTRAAEIEFPSKMSWELAEFLGLCVADGCVHRGGLRLGKRHVEVIDRFDYLAEFLFDIKCVRSQILGMHVADINSTALRDWLLNLGGCNPKQKHTPECVMRSRMDCHAAFLRGLFEDGTVNVKGGKLDHIEWSTSFPRLLKEVRAMLSRLGIISGRNSQKKGRGLLYIYGREAKKFAKSIGFISEFKACRLLMEVSDNTRYLVPVSPSFIEDHRAELGKSNTQNARNRGYLTRSLAERICSPETTELLRWHHSRIKSIRKVTAPTMCIEVPESHRFMQNGFPWGNSQGSEWPLVMVLLDEYPGAKQICDRSWIYTAISRGKQKVFLIGKKSTADAMCRRNNIGRRKTFLREKIQLLHAEKMLELI
jgi:hypothetical protein